MQPLRGLSRVFLRFRLGVATAVGALALLVAYVVVIVPVALVARATGRDVLDIRSPRTGSGPAWQHPEDRAPDRAWFDEQF